MAFTQQDNSSIDFIRMLHARAPNLNSAQILERCRANFGCYPSMQVQNWLHKSLGEYQRAREEIKWRRGEIEWRRGGLPIAEPAPAPEEASHEEER